MKRALRWLIACSEVKKIFEKRFNKVVNWKVNHCVLTFHENLKDDYLARKILSSWLEVAKYRWKLKQYVWKAEPQARGAIHFHLSSNVYMPHAEVRYTWNRALRKHHLNNIEDNSIDVHAVVDETKMVEYFADYLTDKEKHEGRRKIKGKLWSSSHDLAAAGSSYLVIPDDEIAVLVDEFKSYDLRSIITSKGKEIPDFLKFVNYWCVPPGKLAGMILEMYNSEIKLLQDNQSAKLPSLFSTCVRSGCTALALPPPPLPAPIKDTQFSIF